MANAVGSQCLEGIAVVRKSAEVQAGGTEAHLAGVDQVAELDEEEQQPAWSKASCGNTADSGSGNAKTCRNSGSDGP